jgi:hypothetical protein
MGIGLWMRKKGKNREFWLKTHNVAANSWGKGGLGNGQSFTAFMLLLGMGPQHLLLYAKKIVIRLGDGLWAVNWLGNYPKASYSLATFYFLQLLWVYAGCNGATSIRTWAVVVQLAYIHGQVVVQGTYIFKNLVFKKSYSVLAWKK